MKRALLVLFGVVCFYLVSIFFSEEIKNQYRELVYFSYCDTPIPFTIGSIDPEFNITKQTFKSDVISASEIWNNAINKRLFVYDPNAALDISLVFDERQRLLNNINLAGEQILDEKEEFESYVSEYEARQTEITSKINKLNAEIEKWNKRGGAPKAVYENIIKDQFELRKEIERLNSEAVYLNKTQFTINQKVDELNLAVDEFNTVLDTKPEEGLFIGGQEKIEIYFYDSKDRFIHTVTHEFGHALDLNHINKEGAIMHPTTSDSTNLTAEDLALLNNYCEEVNKLELFYSTVSDFTKSISLW